MNGAKIVPTRLSEILNERMQERKITNRQLAEEIGLSYEGVRRVTSGQYPPGPHALEQIAKVLGFNFVELHDINVKDKLQRKYGKVISRMAGKNPELDPIEHYWGYLSDEHKRDIIAMVKTYANRDTERK